MKKIGWIGAGVMGHGMVQHLINAWNEVRVWNRTKSKTDDLVALWAMYCDSMAKLSAESDIIFSIIWDPKNVEETYFWELGILENAKQGSILVDMTTTKPSLAVKIYESAKEKWITSLDAPVSGWELWATGWTLSIMAGWDRDRFNEVLPLFELMGKTVEYCGKPGTGQHTKMANQISIGHATVAVCESLLYAQKAGLCIDTTMKVISSWAAGSWAWDNLAPKIASWELHTNFFIKHFVKDLRILLDECQSMEISLPGISLVHQLYTTMIAYGEADLGTQALIKALKRMNNITLDSE